MFAVELLPRLLNPKGLLLGVGLAVSFVAAALVIPHRWFFRWEALNWLLRALVLSALTYAFVVTVGNFGELYNFRVWLEFLLPQGASPFTPTHATAVVLGMYIFTTQDYKLSASTSPDKERVLSGQPTIPFEEAQRRARKLSRGDNHQP